MVKKVDFSKSSNSWPKFICLILLYIFVFSLTSFAEDFTDSDNNFEFVIRTSQGFVADSTEVLIIANVVDQVSPDINITDVTFKMELPSSVTFSGIHSEIGTASPVEFTEESGFLEWKVGSLSQNENLRISFFVTPTTSDSAFVGGTSSFASYSINSENPTNFQIGIIPLSHTEFKPDFGEVSLYQGKSCSSVLPLIVPLDSVGCVKVMIRDDDLNLDSVLLKDSSLFVESNILGDCKQITYSQKPYSYECKFRNVNYLSIHPGEAWFNFKATDLSDNTIEKKELVNFQSAVCDMDLAFRLAGSPDHYAEIVVTDAAGIVRGTKTITRSTGAPLIEHMIIDNVQGSQDLIITIKGYSYEASGGNPLSIMINGKKTSNLVFNRQENSYSLVMSAFTLMGSQNCCEKLSCVPSDEICDGNDNDCDGSIDEFYESSKTIEGGICGECILDDFQYCNAYLLGACAGGLQICEEDSITGLPTWSQCESMIGPVLELGDLACDNIDNDCDGLIDEDASCGNNVCISGETRPCECNCEEATILMILDDNHHGEDTDDFYQIYDELVSLGINVVQVDEEEFAGSSNGFSYEKIKDYDMVWFSNPGWPIDDEASLYALLRYYEAGNPLVMQGDDLTYYTKDLDLINQLTGLTNYGYTYEYYNDHGSYKRFNGPDEDHVVTFSSGNNQLLAGLSGESFTYVADDIDVAVANNDRDVLATAVLKSGSNSVGYPTPVITLQLGNYINELRKSRFVKASALLTFAKIEPEAVRKLFTANLINYMLNMAGKCECGPANPPECGIAVQVCHNGDWGMCEGVPTISIEVCNQKDDNCNGEIDEGLECSCNINDPPLTCGPDVEVEGICDFGHLECVQQGNSFAIEDESQCDAVYSGNYSQVEHGSISGTCTPDDCGNCQDDLDNDCDGLLDFEDPDCPCLDSDADGICDSTDTCKDDPNGPEKGVCILDVTKIDLTSGIIDPASVGLLSSITYGNNCFNVGDCGGSEVCALAQEKGACECLPVREFCNGIDDDCDGIPDDGISCDCTLEGSLESCGTNQNYCVMECLREEEDSLVYGECMNQYNTDNIFVQSIEICSNGIDEDCDGIDNLCSSCEDVFGNLIIPPDAPDFYEGDIAYYMPEKPEPSYIVEPAKSILLTGSDFILPTINFEFEIKKVIEEPSVEFEVSVDYCELNDDRNLFLDFYEAPSENDLVIACPIELYRSNPNACFVNNRLHGNLLTLAPSNYLPADEMLRRLIDDVGNFSIKCHLNITTSIDNVVESETCGSSGHVLEIKGTVVDDRVCDDRLCLIQKEMDHEFWMKGGLMQTVETLDDIMTVGTTICMVIPTTTSLMDQIGNTVELSGVTLRVAGNKIPVVGAAMMVIGCGLQKAGGAVQNAAEKVQDYVWYNKIDGNFPSVNFWCDIFFGCTFREMLEDQNFISFLMGDLTMDDLTTQANAVDENGDNIAPGGNYQSRDSGHYDAIDNFQDGYIVTDVSQNFVNNVASGIGDVTKNIVSSVTNKLRQDCERDVDCKRSFTKCDPVMKKCIPERETNPGTTQDLFSQGIGSDNLIFSILSLCPQDIVRNLKSYREIHCTYVDCLMTGQSTSDCVVGRNDAFCRKVYGTIFELFGPFRLMSAVKSYLQYLLANFPSIVLSATYQATCDIWNTKMLAVDVVDPTCTLTLPEAKLAHVVVCQLPKTIYTSIDTYSNLEAYILGMVDFFEKLANGDDAFGLTSTCDKVLEKEVIVDELLGNCSCAKITGTSMEIGDTQWSWN